MTESTQKPSKNRTWLYIALFALAAVATIVVVAVLMNIQGKKDEATQYPLKVVEIAENELDPAVWGLNFPVQYDSFKKTAENYGPTTYGGSEPYSKLERVPAMTRLWAGYAFSKDHNEDRGHYYALQDQMDTERVKIVEQPGACANCHAAETPQLIAEMGWENFNHTPYNELKESLHLGSSCADCHDPDTMALRITRPAFINAMEKRGIDVTQATRQEMRTYVCAQCHVEYYFQGENKLLTFPWENGLAIENIEQYYNDAGFKDWTHKETGAPMLKMQHPEFELFSSGLHAQSGVACADCHMPYVREGSVKVSDHWLRSPKVNVATACQTCHSFSEEELTARIETIQDRTAQLLRSSEEALIAAIDTIVAAREAGATDEELNTAMQLHRAASMRWDFISSENSTGFHSPQESARVLADSIDLARQAELEAYKVLTAKQGAQAAAGQQLVSAP
ncbi:MAG: ammonia-forming cytochrome c nitrite reductase subunit c552 [Caldilinea sp.]|nr:ammonia-forming cytochrome c nitrite reductase subunit c552 [Caldilinea sp.]MCB0057666.1 ammonia-forming cytochrome c nitrite reductase subunit c552 [Caldilineaceae bacterium]MCB0066371.1 ammonia-forming cytochrome c nitrite reductase subunit c552 [Caldilineaceae bacterium]MCB0149108.1 ammonia-forming cytochrome c nitrite reductase subunit c552 [Caldilineaceae bacterium]MCB9117106.1 ammonia-forming cytochrome c nitrite reductase subunit c552 [Caldilineaceae bacterium]